MTKKSIITPVPTVFLMRHYQSTNHQKIVPPKEYCRHRCNFRFYSSVAAPQNRVLLTKIPNFQDKCLLGYRCVPGVTILYYIFLDTFLHLFNVETGTINSAINSNKFAFDREFNSTPFHSAQIFKLILLCAIIVLQISFVYKHFCSIESVKSNSIVSTCDYYIDSTC